MEVAWTVGGVGPISAKTAAEAEWERGRIRRREEREERSLTLLMAFH
jgi:hypothetical protein